MPCNSDYMLPNEQERLADKENLAAIKERLDFLVHQADVIREDIIAVLDGEREALKGARSLLGTTCEDPTIGELMDVRESLYGASISDELATAVDVATTQYATAVKAAQDLLVGDALDEQTIKSIRVTQTLHRFADMMRLMQPFFLEANLSEEAQEKILTFVKADCTRPLEPQIGFDPDDM